MKILLGNGVHMDLDKLIESRLLIQANSGGGKSYTIRRFIEQSFGEKQIIVLDPEGEFGNLRTKFDFVYCGKGGDAPVESRSAALLAHRLLELKASAIIDLYELPPQERKHFVRLFCEAMVNAPKELWHDVFVIVDEAHVFAPEKDQSESLSAIIDLASRGRKRGFCAVLATQRPAKLNKDAAAECNNKLIGRASLDIDRKRASEELGFSTKESVLSLRDLNPGEFYAFGPAISREVTRVTIADVTVKPPKRGVSRGTVPAPSATVKKMLAKLADLPQEAQKQAQTNSELRQELAKAKGEITRLKVSNSPAELPKELQEKWYQLGEAAANTLWKKEVERIKIAANAEMKRLQDILRTIGKLVGTPVESIEIEVRPIVTSMPGRDERSHPPVRIPTPLPNTEDVNEYKPLSKGARLVLSYLHQSYPHWKSKTQMWIATGYAPGGGFNNLVYELTGAGLIEKDGTGKYASLERHTPDQIDDSFDPSLSKWDAKLSLGARKVFHVLMDSTNEAFSKEALAQQTGYAMGGGFNNLIYELTGKELAVKTGTNYQVNPEVLDL